MKKLIITAGMLFCILLVLPFVLLNDSEEVRPTVTFSEPDLTIDEVYELSDLVVEANVKKLKEKKVKTFLAQSVDPESFLAKEKKDDTIKAHVTIYELEIIKDIKGEVKSKTIQLVMPDINIEEVTEIKVGNNYRFFLEENTYYGFGVYNLVSFSKGKILLD